MKSKLILLSVTIMLISGVAVFFLTKKDGVKETGPSLPPETVTAKVSLPSPREAPEGYAEYRNAFHRFQLLYPDYLEVNEENVAAGTTLITFVSTIDDRSFQVFIVPHGSPDITPYRLEQDLPSGVMDATQEITIDGVKATAFESTATGIGDTREVWFVNKGFLYEVTTSLPNDAWLSEIMTDWMFL